VKCQTGKWIALANVVAFQDITEKERSGPPALAASYKQAKEDFDKRAKDHMNTKAGGNDENKSNDGKKIASTNNQTKAKPDNKSLLGKDQAQTSQTKSKAEQNKVPADVQVTQRDAPTKASGGSTPSSKQPQVRPKPFDEGQRSAAKKDKEIKAGVEEKAHKVSAKRNLPEEEALTPKSKKSKPVPSMPSYNKSVICDLSIGSANKSLSKSGYIDSTGNDSNPGSPKTPVQSKTAQKKEPKPRQSQKKVVQVSDDDKENARPDQHSAVKSIKKPRSKTSNLKKTLTSVIEKEVVKKSMLGHSQSSSDSSSICHHCGLNTDEPKSKCSSKICPGVRGQFCKTCLKNHYDEDVEAALRNPSWQCPPCRGCCKCSTCRNLEQRHSTGILSQLALNRGHQTVKSYLESIIKKLGK